MYIQKQVPMQSPTRKTPTISGGGLPTSSLFVCGPLCYFPTQLNSPVRTGLKPCGRQSADGNSRPHGKRGHAMMRQLIMHVIQELLERLLDVVIYLLKGS